MQNSFVSECMLFFFCCSDTDCPRFEPINVDIYVIIFSVYVVISAAPGSDVWLRHR